MDFRPFVNGDRKMISLWKMPQFDNETLRFKTIQAKMIKRAKASRVARRVSFCARVPLIPVRDSDDHASTVMGSAEPDW